jgi:hypothetical protein
MSNVGRNTCKETFQDIKPNKLVIWRDQKWKVKTLGFCPNGLWIESCQNPQRFLYMPYTSFTSHNFTSSRIQGIPIVLTPFSCQPQTSRISPVHSYTSFRNRTGDNWRHTHHILRIQNFNKVITLQSKWLIQYTYLAMPLYYGTGFFQTCVRPRIR